MTAPEIFTRDPSTYQTLVATHDHHNLAMLPAYAALRQAMSDLANQHDDGLLADFVRAVLDMASTTPYADACSGHREGTGCRELAWPYAVGRNGDWLTCSYRCPACRNTWTCGYAVDVVRFI